MNPVENDLIFNQLGKSFGKYTFEALVDSKNDRNGSVAILLALALLAYGGVEAVQLIFRKNFGKKGVNVYRLILSTIVFVVLAIVSFNYYNDYTSDLISMGSKSSFLATGIFYLALAVFILVKGILALSQKKTHAIHESYRGDSGLLGFLARGTWSQSLVQNLAEPLLLMSIGFFLLPINSLWGIPLMFCALSSWIHLLMETIMGIVGIRNILSDKGFVHSKNKGFTEVVN